MTQRKGITPVIAIIILLLITVALAGTAMTYLQGYLFQQVTKTFQIPGGGAYCESGAMKIYISNVGYQSPIVSPTDFILSNVDGASASSGLQAITLNPGEAGLVFDYSCGSTCDSGYHTVDLGTGSSIKHIQIYCP